MTTPIATIADRPAPASRDWNAAEFLLAGKDGARTALCFLDRSYTYGELEAAARAVRGFLLGAGLKKGDRVILVSENSFFWAAAYLGTILAGLTSVPLATNVAPAEFEYILRVTGPGCCFLQAEIAARMRRPLTGFAVVTDRRLTEGQTTFEDVCVRHTRMESEAPASGGDDLAALMFTSGSTGRPRGVMVSHTNIIANTNSIVESLQLTETDRMMAVLPFHYCFGASLLHTHLRIGGSLVVDNRFRYPEEILQRMLSARCTGFAGVPSHFQILVRNSSLRKKRFPYLRHVQQAGGHLAPALVRELREALPDARVFVMYGQTEATARLSCLPPELGEAKAGSIGKGIPGVRLSVLDEQGAPVRPGAVGEIVAEGENVARGYWQDPAESAISFRNGRLHTGDLATVDEDGFIYIVDRAKDFIKCGGARVSCRQLEEKLLELTDLLEAAVVGMPDEILGEAVRAFIVPCRPGDAGLEERVLRFCKKELRPLLVPKQITVLRGLPKNSSGKVLKQALKGLQAG